MRAGARNVVDVQHTTAAEHVPAVEQLHHALVARDAHKERTPFHRVRFTAALPLRLLTSQLARQAQSTDKSNASEWERASKRARENEKRGKPNELLFLILLDWFIDWPAASNTSDLARCCTA